MKKIFIMFLVIVAVFCTFVGCQDADGSGANSGSTNTTVNEGDIGIDGNTGNEENTDIDENTGNEENTDIDENTGNEENTDIDENTGNDEPSYEIVTPIRDGGTYIRS